MNDEGIRMSAKRKTPASLKHAVSLLPYVVPPAYVERQAVSPDGLVRHLGHDVYTMIVIDLGGLCRNLLDTELAGSASEAYSQAIKNLIRLVDTRKINMGVLKGPRDWPYIVAEGHWAAASCILLPRLHEIATEHLASPDLLAAVPSRGSLIVFRQSDDGYTREIRKLIRKAERFERKLVSNSLFKVTPEGPSPVGATEPAPRASFLSRWFGA